MVGLGGQALDMVEVEALCPVKNPMGFTVVVREWVTVEVCFWF